MTEEHLCLTCRRAEWKRTAAGKLHPDGSGRCGWKLPHIPKAAAFTWGVSWGAAPAEPGLSGGYIERRADIPYFKPITACETYEVKA